MKVNIDVENLGFERIITVKEKRKKYIYFGKIIEKVEKYRGSSTVWYHYPSVKRCGTLIESWLSDIEQAWLWEQKDKNF